jgi:hypothetical protein
VTGFTGFSDFRTMNAIQKAFAGRDFDAFVVKLNPAGSDPSYSSYLGGDGDDGGYGIALDATGNAYVTGFTSSRSFPIRNPLQRGSAPASGDIRGAFVARIADNRASP